MFRKIIKGLLGLFFTLALLAIVVYVATGPQQLKSDSASIGWLQAGPYSAGSAEFVFIDESRPTDESRGNPGKPNRTFPTTIWYPEDAKGTLPLIVHSHGIVSTRNELAYLMEHLASYGYVVAAADYPLTSGSTFNTLLTSNLILPSGDVLITLSSLMPLPN